MEREEARNQNRNVDRASIPSSTMQSKFFCRSLSSDEASALDAIESFVKDVLQDRDESHGHAHAVKVKDNVREIWGLCRRGGSSWGKEDDKENGRGGGSSWWKEEDKENDACSRDDDDFCCDSSPLFLCMAAALLHDVW